MWEKLLVQLFMGLLSWLAQRHDLRESVKSQVAEREDRAAMAALSWGLACAGDPARFADDRVGMLHGEGRHRIVAVDADPLPHPDGANGGKGPTR